MIYIQDLIFNLNLEHFITFSLVFIALFIHAFHKVTFKFFMSAQRIPKKNLIYLLTTQNSIHFFQGFTFHKNLRKNTAYEKIQIIYQNMAVSELI